MAPEPENQATLARLAPTVLVLVLLAATAAAFALAERLKLEQAAVLGPRIDRFLSPGCRCPHARAAIRFRLLSRDHVTVTVVDRERRVVRTLARSRLEPARRTITFRWDGRADEGARVPDGAYRVRIHLAERRRTVRIPFPVHVDTRPPDVTLVSVTPRELLEGLGPRARRVKIRYRLSERARVVIAQDGLVRVRALRDRPYGQLDWYALSHGRALGPGVYRVSVVATDAAGNRSAPATVRIRVLPRHGGGTR